MKHTIIAFSLVLLCATSLPAVAKAQTSDTAGLLATLQSLLKQVEELQSQLAALRGEIREELKAGLKEGVEDEGVKKIQELLATDPVIYPRGIVSGYYGPLTKEAIMRFQERHGLPLTGEVDEATRALFNEYFKERQNGNIPVGLLKAPGISKKMMERRKLGDDDKYYVDCEDKRGAGPLCNKDKINKEEPKDVSEEDAETSIDAAKSAIADLAEAIELASSSEAKDDAEEDLEKAEEELVEAEAELADEDFESAYEKALKAKKLALEGLDELNEDDDDDDDDDDDNDND